MVALGMAEQPQPNEGDLNCREIIPSAGALAHIAQIREGDRFPSPSELRFLQGKCAQLLQLGMIVQSSARHQCKAYVAPQATGELGIYIDYSSLAERVRPDDYPCPGEAELERFQAQAGPDAFVSAMPVAHFHNAFTLHMPRDSLPLSAFVLPTGEKYEWTIATPFDFPGARQCLQRRLDDALHGLPFARAFHNWVVVISPSLEQHLPHMEQVLNAIGGIPLKFNQFKSVFGIAPISKAQIQEMLYLGKAPGLAGAGQRWRKSGFNGMKFKGVGEAGSGAASAGNAARLTLIDEPAKQPQPPKQQQQQQQQQPQQQKQPQQQPQQQQQQQKQPPPPPQQQQQQQQQQEQQGAVSRQGSVNSGSGGGNKQKQRYVAGGVRSPEWVEEWLPATAAAFYRSKQFRRSMGKSKSAGGFGKGKGKGRGKGSEGGDQQEDSGAAAAAAAAADAAAADAAAADAAAADAAAADAAAAAAAASAPELDAAGQEEPAVKGPGCAPDAGQEDLRGPDLDDADLADERRGDQCAEDSLASGEQEALLPQQQQQQPMEGERRSLSDEERALLDALLAVHGLARQSWEEVRVGSAFWAEVPEPMDDDDESDACPCCQAKLGSFSDVVCLHRPTPATSRPHVYCGGCILTYAGFRIRMKWPMLCPECNLELEIVA